MTKLSSKNSLWRGLQSVIIFMLLMAFACNPRSTSWQAEAMKADVLHEGIARLTEIIKIDIFSPPVASRIYAYSTVAAYEALAAGDSDYASLAGQLTDLTPVPQPLEGEEYCFPLAGISAMLVVGKALVFSESRITDMNDQMLDRFREMGIPKDVFDRSLDYGKSVAQHILEWSKSDYYAESRSLPKFTISQADPSRWIPTPPSYNDALEPYWKDQRIWALDSITQYLVDPPIPFSTDPESDFYRAAAEVVQIRQDLTQEQEDTAWYWDDNPFAMEASGHLMQTRKKTSPGGHWMFIASAACRKAEADIMTSAQALVLTSLALADGFIVCWHEKYRTNVIRPETYINLYIDPAYTPIIETPPFPEHPSGHATISAAAATVLTAQFGDNFAFVDSNGMDFGMAPRAYPSFMAAAEESAMSRLYGGIHYRHGNATGTRLGQQIGAHIATHIQTLLKE
jgi:hypothetical protein